MDDRAILTCVPLVAALAWAAAGDVRTRRIPNALTFALVVTGLAQGFTPGGVVSPAWSGLGLLTGFALTLPLFAIGALGGGDVKLLAGVGAWLGPGATLAVFAVEAVVGMVLVLVQAAAQGKLVPLLRNTGSLALNLAYARQVGPGQVKHAAAHVPTVDRPLPYAVPVLIAVVAVLAGEWFLRR